MKEYTVKWEIEVEADTPTAAAREALKIQQDPTSQALFFDVVDTEGGSLTEVDLAQSFSKILDDEINEHVAQAGLKYQDAAAEEPPARVQEKLVNLGAMLAKEYDATDLDLPSEEHGGFCRRLSPKLWLDGIELIEKFGICKARAERANQAAQAILALLEADILGVITEDK